MVSTCDSSPRRSLGATVGSSTSARARERKTSLPLSSRSTRRRQMSRSAKSKVPSCGQATTLRTISFCTLLEWDMARSCHMMSTSQMRSIACGSLLLRSIFVSCASFSARNSRWHCCVRVTMPPILLLISLSTSFHVCSTDRHVTKRSWASLTTAPTTPVHSPKRSGSRSSFHFSSSFSSSMMSPSSMAVCSGGNSRSTCFTLSVTSRSIFSCASVCMRATSRRRSASAFSSASSLAKFALISTVCRCMCHSSSRRRFSASSCSACTRLVVSSSFSRCMCSRSC
mmetsp:Transcript_37118/g.95846  ORF Transcript_37118/g.95846 Transcript_37118/m.95846 type:complete len:284 (+) Transcript_37118:3018-3869(+)